MTRSLSVLTTFATLIVMGASILPGTVLAQPAEGATPKSQFMGELKGAAYPEITDLDSPRSFSWDFSAKHDTTYSYNQQIRNSHKTSAMRAGGKSSSSEMTISSNATLVIRSNGDHSADVILKDLALKMKMPNGKTMEQQPQPIAAQGIPESPKVDSTFEFDNKLIKSLFPLPHGSLSPGQSVKRPATRTFSALGSHLIATGTLTVTLDRYVTIDQRRCARIHAIIDISSVKVPPELKGDYQSETKLESLYYFDIDRREVVSGIIAGITGFAIDAPTPQMAIPSPDKAKVAPTIQMAVWSDNLIKITPIAP